MSPGDHALAAFAILAPTSVDCWLHQEKVSTGTAYCQPGKENPFGPRILVTTLAVSLLILGSSAEVTPAPAEVVLLSPLGILCDLREQSDELRRLDRVALLALAA
jgi:hypothetical protein